MIEVGYHVTASGRIEWAIASTGFLSWYAVSRITLDDGAINEGTWRHLTRRGARLRIGRDLLALTQMTPPDADETRTRLRPVPPPGARNIR